MEINAKTVTAVEKELAKKLKELEAAFPGLSFAHGTITVAPGKEFRTKITCKVAKSKSQEEKDLYEEARKTYYWHKLPEYGTMVACQGVVYTVCGFRPNAKNQLIGKTPDGSRYCLPISALAN